MIEFAGRSLTRSRDRIRLWTRRQEPPGGDRYAAVGQGDAGTMDRSPGTASEPNRSLTRTVAKSSMRSDALSMTGCVPSR
ncbi:MAG: hypothetical protein AVDCRST_MAG70-2226 [uncultured Thermomicrobiales bacterium]|uniref:Uncharacterized protein n=1 Tax=uncultured Thermomicrobiales bacterium TaxID=1645740 RepID=A0A6J4V4Q9_9BACT|nr:MAG: hypothetical protein AVDCRST_MAG70-2226 [uncultured Thermomicrobiales bacterium]